MAFSKNLCLVTNPHQFTVTPTTVDKKPLTFLATSGQNIQDMMSYTNDRNSLDQMEACLEMAHMAPTCPDTLRCYSFTEKDPFILDQAPHIFIAGNMDQWNERWAREKKTKKSQGVHSYPDLPTKEKEEEKVDSGLEKRTDIMDCDDSQDE